MPVPGPLLWPRGPETDELYDPWYRDVVGCIRQAVILILFGHLVLDQFRRSFR